jgi:hypothetical protein
MTYKVIPAPLTIEFKGNDLSMITDYFQELINQEAQKGWTYHSMETVSGHRDAVYEKSGCFGLGQPKLVQAAKNITVYMLIFSKESSAAPQAADQDVNA